MPGWLASSIQSSAVRSPRPKIVGDLGLRPPSGGLFLSSFPFALNLWAGNIRSPTAKATRNPASGRVTWTLHEICIKKPRPRRSNLSLQPTGAILAMKAKKSATKKSAAKKPATKSRAVAETVKPVSISASERKRIQEEEARWRAQDDLRILRSSQEIMSDPARIKRAQALADEEIRALKSVKSRK